MSTLRRRIAVVIAGAAIWVFTAAGAAFANGPPQIPPLLP